MNSVDKRVQVLGLHQLAGRVQRALVIMVDAANGLVGRLARRPLGCQQGLEFDIIPVIQLFAEAGQRGVGRADGLRKLLAGDRRCLLRMGDDISGDLLFTFAEPEAEKLQPVLKTQISHGFLLKIVYSLTIIV